MNFNDLKTTRKGNIGEDIIIDELTKRRYLCFQASRKKSHKIDLCVFKNNTHFFADVKTKPRMKKYNATGIQLKHYYIYKELSKENKVILFFVDEFLEKIYYGDLNKLDKKCIIDGIKYPNINICFSVILFPLNKMKILRPLMSNELRRLKDA